ncbi:MAG: aminotransferase class III-fold pyridoxal phosphate-dependent enzyme, partial [Gemmatimonadetes bacterium]|nr:aminotransferase class III-fold pyridoxal phosphate-dependent enzyme [Gemmatimonadota bacterium]
MSLPSQQSQDYYERAVKVIPGGVNSPVRAFRAVGGDPLFIRDARGAHITDADGHEYVDYVGSWGPMVLGHRPPVVTDAIRRILERG